MTEYIITDDGVTGQNKRYHANPRGIGRYLMLWPRVTKCAKSYIEDHRTAHISHALKAQLVKPRIANTNCEHVLHILWRPDHYQIDTHLSTKSSREARCRVLQVLLNTVLLRWDRTPRAASSSSAPSPPLSSHDASSYRAQTRAHGLKKKTAY